MNKISLWSKSAGKWVWFYSKNFYQFFFSHLSGEVTQEWNESSKAENVSQKAVLLSLAKEIVGYFMGHNAEPEACDLLMEIENLNVLADFVDIHAYGKVCLYLIRFVFDFHFGLFPPISTVISLFEYFFLKIRKLSNSFNQNDHVITIQYFLFAVVFHFFTFSRFVRCSKNQCGSMNWSINQAITGRCSWIILFSSSKSINPLIDWLHY